MTGADDPLSALAERLRAGKLERLTFLSDAVFAIAATLAAIELGRDGPPTARALAAYGLSYFVIAVFWWVNRDLLNRLRRADALLTVLVLTMLCAVAVIPAATRGLYGPADAAARDFYAGTMMAAGCINAGQWLYVALRPRLAHRDLARRYLWIRVATTVTVPLVFAGVLLFPAVVPPWAAPLAILLVVALRRTVSYIARGAAGTGRAHG